MDTNQPKSVLIGAHTSAAGGSWNAILQGEKIGATTVQLFTSNQRRWNGRIISQEDAKKFAHEKERVGMGNLMSHASYLLNLGSPNAGNLKKSRIAFREEIIRCLTLGIRYLNFHPGAALEGSRQDCLDRIIESLLETEDLLQDKQLDLLIETTAGQGSTVGMCFEEIGYMIRGVKGRISVGVCVDTAHIFAAGYDIRTGEGWEKTLADFEKNVGLNYLAAFHLNDTICAMGSRKDRHACLGEGLLGWSCFDALMRLEIVKGKPKILETPKPDLWADEIKRLRSSMV
ncbi:MAG: deoxyribonuclease IV [Cytophagales bacterium]